MALRETARLKILFPYLARVRAANWSRYQQLLSARARAGDRVRILEPPPRLSDETNFQEVDVSLPEDLTAEQVELPRLFWDLRLPLDKLIKKGAYSLAANRRVRALFREAPPDVLLVYNLTQRSLLRSAAPVVFDVADDLPAMLVREGSLIGRLLRPIAERTLSRMARRAALVTSPSRVLLSKLPGPALFVPNGVDPEEIRAAAAGAAPPEPRANLRVGFLGSFEYFIDFDFVLELAARMPEAEFLLIGAGRRLGDVRERIARERLPNVRLEGAVAHGQALSRLGSCDFSLCPFTKDEVGGSASPLKLFESLALGVPVVATRTPEILAENPDNVIYADSAEEAAEAIAARIRLPQDARLRMNEEAHRHVLAERSWDRIGEGWAEQVRALLLQARR
jgi:glycosyltransferase involved in cell wall biosynthesis